MKNAIVAVLHCLRGQNERYGYTRWVCREAVHLWVLPRASVLLQQALKARKGVGRWQQNRVYTACPRPCPRDACKKNIFC